MQFHDSTSLARLDEIHYAQQVEFVATLKTLNFNSLAPVLARAGCTYQLLGDFITKRSDL